MNITIRQEQIEDYEITERVVECAFARAEHSDKKEHKLVSRIRKSTSFIPKLSLVAVDHDHNKIIGHLLLSKIKIRNDNGNAESLALAPVSVIPEYQNNGVGKLLIFEALKRAKDLAYNSIVVLGHPEYYPKFGFKKASLWGIEAPFEVPDEAYMAIELHENALNKVSGIVEYPSVFFE
ncbi:GNAT family N-acetyltransferase [Metabacillus sediminilitoris]|uniref:N-acetyltransferase n=1 Tax=Metabacillus sediminilitoris TaxID=2567941 RepID=A0A4S4C5M9_9BACI|nr:N-acetyltransferase [Metabacillus sediminilitoris]QGQ45157.1 GNAT family N-acetyltransferase [Metabacillus sediminilitoris]THF82544.1 N-acetyltransferase [Metabacillus sediminilitoris]